MKNKGFTLIELLAVIVILAIIALIATPVVLNIIKDSKNSSIERSAELYLDQVKNEIARYNMANPSTNFNPSECTVQSDDSLICDGISLKVEINGDKPSAGSKIFLSNGSITGLGNFKISGVELQYIDGKITQGSAEVICTRVTSSKVGNVPQGKYKAGDEYICKVNDTTSYNFYILSTNGSKVNMMMSKNICSDGSTQKTSTNTCVSAWTSKEDYIAAGGTESDYGEYGNNNKGPITALKYLDKATSTWDNIPNMSETHVDESGRYGKIVINGKARLIYRSEVLNITIKLLTPELAQPSAKFLLGDEWIGAGQYPFTMDTCYGDHNWALSYYGSIEKAQEATKYYVSGIDISSKILSGSVVSGEEIIFPVITLNKSNLQ